MGKLVIRPEEPRDFERIEAVIRSAFEGHPLGSQNEHRLVAALRQRDALSVALVAESGGEVIGHIAFSKVTIDGKDLSWYGLAPVAVAPDYQRQGVGTKLITAGLGAIRKLGARGCVLVGEPGYYGRFGFREPKTLRLVGVPPKYFLALSFSDSVPSGTVAYHEVFARFE